MRMRSVSFRLLATALLAVAGAGLSAQSRIQSGLVVLPALIEGAPERSGFYLANLPGAVQEASRFLLTSASDYPVQDLAKTNAVLTELDFAPEQSLTRSRAERICSASGRSYFLAPGVTFRGPEQIFLQAMVYSCQSGRVQARQRRASNAGDFQRDLRLLLQTVTAGFARPRESGAASLDASDSADAASFQPVDLAVVLDLSGSMTEDAAAIAEGLAALSRQVPAGSRIAIVSIQAGDQVDTLPFSKDWDAAVGMIRRASARGEVTLQGVGAALSFVERYREWRGARRLFVFTDAETGGDRRADLESRLRRLKSRGIETRLFSLLNQSYAARQEWQRLARSLSLPDPGVVYGRRAGYAGIDSLFFAMDGARVFQSTADLRAEIQAGRIPEDRARPIESAYYNRSELNLRDLPAAYARRNNLRLASLGPVFSSLEQKIADSLGGAGPGNDAAAGRVLLKNEGDAFWIRVGSPQRLQELRELRGQKRYIGMHLAPAPAPPERLVNLPREIYIRTQGETPRLFVTTWSDLNRRAPSSLHRSDVWFVLVEILEVGDERDLRD